MSYLCQKREVFILCPCIEGPSLKPLLVIPRLIVIDLSQWPTKKFHIYFLLVLFSCAITVSPHVQRQPGVEVCKYLNALPVLSHLIETQTEDLVSYQSQWISDFCPQSTVCLLCHHMMCDFFLSPPGKQEIEGREHFGVLISSGEILMGYREQNYFQSLKKSSVIWKYFLPY